MRDVMGLLTRIKKSYAEGLTSVWWCLEKETSGNNEVQRRPSDWSPPDGIGFLIRKDTGELALFTPPPVPSLCVCARARVHAHACVHAWIPRGKATQGQSKNVAICRPKRESSSGMNRLALLILDFPSFRTVKNQFPLCQPPMEWCFVQPLQSLSCVQLFVTPWTAAHQASLSITNSQSLLKLMSIERVMPSNHLILCRPLLLLPSIFPSIRVYSNESVLHIRWPQYWSFSFSISSFNEYSGLISFRMDQLDLLADLTAAYLVMLEWTSIHSSS